MLPEGGKEVGEDQVCVVGIPRETEMGCCSRGRIVRLEQTGVSRKQIESY